MYAILFALFAFSFEKSKRDLTALGTELCRTQDALAFMLSAKLGSLDDAFQYMDNASRGDSFAFVSWHTGLLVLRIDS